MRLSHKGGVLISLSVCLILCVSHNALHSTPCAHTEERTWENTARRQPSTGQEDRSHKKLTMNHNGTLILDCPVSRTVRKEILFKPLSLRYFVMVAQTKIMIFHVSLGSGWCVFNVSLDTRGFCFLW